MKSFVSLLTMLAVVAAVLGSGYWLYTESGGSHAVSATGSGTSLTLRNDTAFGLTVELKGPALVQFAISPGKSQKRSIAPGTYAVKGKLSDPKTDGFGGNWTFEKDHQYNAGFTRTEAGGSSGLVGGLIRSGSAQP
jgi:hypothetical protein